MKDQTDIVIAGSLKKYGFYQADNVFSTNGLCPVILAHLQGQIGHQINILEEDGSEILVAVWDTYNHAILVPDISPTIQPRHQVPNHGARLVFEECGDE